MKGWRKGAESSLINKTPAGPETFGTHAKKRANKQVKKPLGNDTQAIAHRPSYSEQEALKREGEGKKWGFFCSIESSLTARSFPPISTSQHRPLDSLFPRNKADIQADGCRVGLEEQQYSPPLQGGFTRITSLDLGRAQISHL